MNKPWKTRGGIKRKVRALIARRNTLEGRIMNYHTYWLSMVSLQADVYWRDAIDKTSQPDSE